MTSATLIDLNQPSPGFGPSTQYKSKLKPFKRGNHCPICDSNDGRCKEGDEIINCMTETYDVGIINGYKFRKLSKNNKWGVWAPHTGDDFNAIEWKARKAIREKQDAEERQKRIDRELPASQRDLLYRPLGMTRGLESRFSISSGNVISKKIGWPKRLPYPKYVASILSKSSAFSPERKPIFDLATVDTALAKSSPNPTGSASQYVSSTDSLQQPHPQLTALLGSTPVECASVVVSHSPALALRRIQDRPS